MLQSTSAALAPTQDPGHSKLKPDDSSSLTDVTVYEIVSVNVWPPSTATATVLSDSVVWKTHIKQQIVLLGFCVKCV
jgi:hypothetical protein